MNYAAGALVDVHFEHSYFTGPFDGLSVSVSERTRIDMLNHGLLFKPFPGGFKLLFDSTFNSSARSREQVLESGLLLQFTATLKDHNFYTYTQLEASKLGDKLFYFSNGKGRASDSLHKTPFASAGDLYRYPFVHFGDQFFSKPFAKIALRLKAGIPGNYSVRFQAATAYWRYILVSDNLQSLKNPAILDEHSAVAFEGPHPIELPANKKALAFVSSKPLKLSARPSAIYQLVEQYQPGETRHRTVLRSLPAPDINRISRIENESTCSDIFIY